jgi:outer membrane protein assembly factor BamA
VNQLVGTRKAKASIEVRLPLLGPERLALIPFRYVPTELTLFTDAGLAWTGDEAPSLTWTTDPDPGQRVPVVSAGVATRHNILGAFVLELYYAQPFQRPEAGGQFGLRFLPGW